eukprot:3216349-Alexandrium_andersonii.AAC.1
MCIRDRLSLIVVQGAAGAQLSLLAVGARGAAAAGLRGAASSQHALIAAGWRCGAFARLRGAAPQLALPADGRQ